MDVEEWTKCVREELTKCVGEELTKCVIEDHGEEESRGCDSQLRCDSDSG